MRNKLIFSAVFLCFYMPVFSQDIPEDSLLDIQIEQRMADKFIDYFFWYQKYLPLEYISEYYTLRNLLGSLRTNDLEEYDLASKALYERILYLTNLAHGRILQEIERIRPKLNILNAKYRSSVGVPELVEQFFEFTRDINNGNYPHDDTLLGQIEEYYSRLVTKYGYVNTNFKTYIVQNGDSLRKISKIFYGNEMLWKSLVSADTNKDNRKFLPNPKNFDLIYPGVKIVIPPLRIQE